MSEMTKMLHYQTSSGSTGACKIYTTLDECPYPNLKVQVDGTTGYVKLSKDSSDPNKTPIKVYVTSSGKTYNALTVAIPTGMCEYPYWFSTYTTTFRVPLGIHVIKSYSWYPGSNKPMQEEKYIGVTSGKIYSLNMQYKKGCSIYNLSSNKMWAHITGGSPATIRLEWSPQINKMTPTVKDY